MTNFTLRAHRKTADLHRAHAELRHIKVALDAPTRHGETELYLLSSVPEALADAPTLARLYRQRWTIERAFLHLTVQLRCEVDTLSYPPAALFALACAMVVFNVLGVVKAALRAAHGAEVQSALSSHAMATHMRSMAQSLNEMLQWCDGQYRQVRERLSSRQRFFNDLRTLSCYLRFPSWEAMPAFMIETLDQPFTPHAQGKQSP